MLDDEAIGAIIAGCEAALEHGSSDVRVAARMLLVALGCQIAERIDPDPNGPVVAEPDPYRH